MNITREYADSYNDMAANVPRMRTWISHRGEQPGNKGDVWRERQVNWAPILGRHELFVAQGRPPSPPTNAHVVLAPSDAAPHHPPMAQ